MPYDTKIVEQRGLGELIEIGADASGNDLEIAMFKEEGTEGRMNTYSVKALAPHLTSEWRDRLDHGDRSAVSNQRQAHAAFVTQLCQGATKANVSLREINDEIKAEGGTRTVPINRGEKTMNSLFQRAADLQAINGMWNTMVRMPSDSTSTKDKSVSFKDPITEFEPDPEEEVNNA